MAPVESRLRPDGTAKQLAHAEAGVDGAMGTRVGIGVAQVTGDAFEPERNRAIATQAARAAFEGGADIVILPEMIVPGYVADWRRLAPLAEPVRGATFEAWSVLAREAGGYIVGGLCERDGEALYNSAICVGPDGLLLHYRKAHLFREEKVAFRPGDRGFPVADTRFGRIGVCVCYDLRFIEVVRLMSLRGVDLICVPTAWLPGFDDMRWDKDGMCPQANGAAFQANLSQVFIACASQVGERDGNHFLGSSVVVDPLGHVVLGPLSGSEELTETVTVDISLTKSALVRHPLITPRADRRTDLYRIWCDGEFL
jgi:N-carbamoylputrescine amidase